MKACDPEATIVLVWRDDDAVDQDASDIDENYIIDAMAEPTSWRERLKFKDGHKPVEWVMGVPPSSELNHAEDLDGNAAKVWHVFLHSVRDIKGGQLGEPKKVTRNGVQFVDPAWLASKMVRRLRRCAKELGIITYTWNNMSEEDAGN